MSAGMSAEQVRADPMRGMRSIMTTVGPDGLLGCQPLSVSEALVSMQALVQQGAMQQAIAVGARAAVPLSLSSQDLTMGALLSEGAEGQVYAGTFQAQAVAVKKLRLQVRLQISGTGGASQ